MGSFQSLNSVIAEKFQNEAFSFVSLETSFKVQTYVELLAEAIPMIALQVINNQAVGWSALAAVSFIFSVLVVVKDMWLIVAYLLNRKTEGYSFRP